MPKVYILPEMNVTDRFIRGTIMPNSEQNYKKLGGYWSIFEYYLWNFASLECGESCGLTTLLPAKPIYTFILDGTPLKTIEQLKSFDVKPGKHTLSIDLRLSVSNDYSKPGLYEHFAEKTTYKIYEFNKSLDFNIESGNVFFVLSLKYDVYYPLLYGNQYVMGGKGEGYSGSSNRYFHESHTKNIKNVEINFKQVDLVGMRNLLARHVNYTPYFVIHRNEDLPNEDDNANLRMSNAKVSAGYNTTASQNKSANSHSSNKNWLATNIQSNTISSKNSNFTEQVKAQGKTIAQFIMDRPESKQSENRVARKEVIKYVNFYDTVEFKNSMKGYDYEIVENDVVLKKILSSKKEIMLPNGITVIDENALGGYLNNVVFIEFPYSVKEIKKGAFKDNKYIQKIKLNSNISTIEEGVFNDCSSLKEIIFSLTLKNIKSRAFAGVNLDTVFLPYNARYDSDAFEKGTLVVYGNKKTLEIQKLVECERRIESSFDVKKEVLQIKEPSIEEYEKKLLKDLEDFKLERKQDFENFKNSFSKSNEEILETEKKSKDTEKEIATLKEKIVEIKEKEQTLLIEFLKSHNDYDEKGGK